MNESRLDKLLAAASEYGASDLHLIAGVVDIEGPVTIRRIKILDPGDCTFDWLSQPARLARPHAAILPGALARKQASSSRSRSGNESEANPPETYGPVEVMLKEALKLLAIDRVPRPVLNGNGKSRA